MAPPFMSRSSAAEVQSEVQKCYRAYGRMSCTWRDWMPKSGPAPPCGQRKRKLEHFPSGWPLQCQCFGLAGQSSIHGIHSRWLLDRPVNSWTKSGEGDDNMVGAPHSKVK